MDVKHFTQILQLPDGHAHTKCESDVAFFHRNLHVKNSGPILVLIHGYPQSSYMWRHIIPQLPSHIPLFVPDIPGYGRSTPSQKGDDKRTVGGAILEALEQQLGDDSEHDIVLVGHDRGARICHRLTVDAPCSESKLKVVGTILMDIVPTLEQWQSFQSSAVATGSFHWPFLANVDVATEMIMAQGGDNFCKYLIDRWAGTSSKGLQSLKSEDSMEVYGGYLSQESVVRATCADYRAGAADDVQEQLADQLASRKIQCKTLIIYSADYLGSRFDMRKVWKHWVDDSTQPLQVEGISDSGHFIAEEAPEITAMCVSQFIEDIVLEK